MYGNYPDLSQVKKILVIKLRHHGDVLLTSALFTALKKACPGAAIDAFIYQDTLPMLEGHPALSSFLLYDKGWKKLSFFQKWKKEISLLAKVRREKYDLVINLTEGDRGALAGFFSKAKYRVGFDPQGKGMLGKKRLYTHIAKPCKTPRHTVERNLDVLRAIGIFPSPEERALLLHIPKAASHQVALYLKDAGLEEKKYLVIHAVSRWRFKCPPPRLIAALIRELHAKGERIVLTASPDKDELAMLEVIKKHAPPLLDLGGKTSLKELAALIETSRCLICVDSVPLHMASALKTPVVALFGPSSDQNWGPWNHPQSRVVAKNTPCRPCHLDGCGGSKMSDCLYTLPIPDILEAFDSLMGIERMLSPLTISKA